MRHSCLSGACSCEKEHSADHNNDYAQKILSEEGQHNGLYWKNRGDHLSPIGPLVAAAVTERFAKNRDSAATPYRGYYYHVVTHQGKEAPGGAKVTSLTAK